MAHRRRVNNNGNGEEEEEGSVWAPVLGAVFGAAVGVVSAFAAPAVGNAILDSTGFTDKGIGRQSLASTLQSTANNGTGCVDKDSAFSKLQSKGARGGFESPDALTVLKCAVAGAVFGGGVGEISRQADQNRSRNQ